MEELNVAVNDLYTVTKSFDNSLHSDWVHFGDDGSKIIAEAVVKKINEVL